MTRQADLKRVIASATSWPLGESGSTKVIVKEPRHHPGVASLPTLRTSDIGRPCASSCRRSDHGVVGPTQRGIICLVMVLIMIFGMFIGLR